MAIYRYGFRNASVEMRCLFLHSDFNYPIPMIFIIQINYGLRYSYGMSTDPGSLNPGTRRSRVPRWWYSGIRTTTGAGDTVLAKNT